jgi:hypothetical protein
MQEEKYTRAQRRVRKIRHFYENLITYFLINVLLIAINFIFSPNHLWFYWVTIFWGLAIVIHAIKLFTIRDRFLGDEWEQRKIKEIMDKDSNP